MTLTIGESQAVEIDLRPLGGALVNFIAEYPILSAAIAAGVIYVVWASNQPIHKSQAWR